MLQNPIVFKSKKLKVHAFGPSDLQRYDLLVRDIYNILSDPQTLKYLPGKRLHHLKEAEQFLHAAVLNYHAGRNYLYFITDQSTSKTIGMIDLISPELASEHYQLQSYPHFIEFYLSGAATGSSIMSGILPPLVDMFLSQGISKLGAVVNRQNIAAKKVLKNAGFHHITRFDPMQDLYETS